MTSRVQGPLSVAEARAQILRGSPRVAEEALAVDGLLAGRVLAEDVLAAYTLPPFDNSAMDGYAVRARDVGSVPLRLPVRGEMAAGMAPGAVRLQPQSCAKVMTGAPLPEGADAVVPYEWTDRGEETVLIQRAPTVGNAVRRAGEDLAAGELVLGRGHRLRPVDLAPLTASGRGQVRVARRPRVALLTTGEEIRPPGTSLAPGEILDTAGPAIEAEILAGGGEVVLRERVGDRPEAVERALRTAATAADLVVTVGGVSVGDHDHVRETVERWGRLRLWRVAMRPGRPIAFGTLEGAAFLGLPGNPVSATVTFLLFGVPCLLAMQGAARTDPATTVAELLDKVEKPEGLETFHRVALEPRPGQLPGVRVAGNQSSGATLSLARADALLALPAAGESVPRGALVEVIPL
ncbi:MAG: molybdopterin molybdotransferase MoeA [Candidatus Dormibacteria bacterium]